MSDEDIVRKLMYSQDDDETTKKPKKIKEVSIRPSAKSIIFESGGVRHQVPSWQTFNELLRETINSQNVLQKAQVDIKRLTETVKKLDMMLKNVERELANKADIYGDE